MCMSVYDPQFTINCECVYMVLTLPSDVYVFIWSSLYVEMCMCVPKSEYYKIKCDSSEASKKVICNL